MSVNVSTYHETKQSSQNSRYTPCWIPRVWMKIRNGQAQSCINFKSAVRCSHINARRLKRKLPWEYKFSMVKATFIRRLFWSFYHIMPGTRIYIMLKSLNYLALSEDARIVQLQFMCKISFWYYIDIKK